jgi:uncharacterized protein (DUF488 family)
MPQKNRLKLPASSPRKQADNRDLWNEARTVAGADFFTLGYSGRKLDALIEALKSAGVRTLLDIRQNPISMYRPEVSKTNLSATLACHGIAYVHCPQLGVPRDIRAKAIGSGTREVIWDWYDEHVVQPYVGQNLHHFLNSVEHPVAMMCAELDPTECHRHRLFVALEEKGLRGFDL